MEPALSFHGQPNLKKLVEALTSVGPEDPPVTVVCGAGVSIDSGLPSWATLVDRMCSGVESPGIADVVRADPIDSLRKVDYIVRLRDPRRGLSDLVQDALYESMKNAGPGPLANSIAHLVASLGGRVRVVTTNFDNQLERALKNYFIEHDAVRSSGLFRAENGSSSDFIVDLEDFEESIDVDGEVSVLHLHGLVAPDVPVIEPLILSESYFLRFGAEVKDAVRRFVESSSLTIFVGVSLADPNVVGPLNDLERDRTADASRDMPAVFLLTAPDEIEGQSFGRVQAYTKRKCEYYQQQFGVSPILLKSYGQVAQTMFELSVALADPPAYCDDESPETSTRYGFRLERALTKAYRAVTQEDLSGVEESRMVSDGLSRALDIIERRLITWREHLEDHELEENRLHREDLRNERFALFLWLRLRDADKPHEDGPVPYALQMIGSSAYSYREQWLTPSVVPIEPGQTYASARAAYFGTTQLTGITRTSPWRTNLSVPIVVPVDDGIPEAEAGGSMEGAHTDAIRGPVTIGVASLDSTHALAALDRSEETPKSLLGGLSDVQFEQLAKETLDAVQREVLVWPEIADLQTKAPLEQ